MQPSNFDVLGQTGEREQSASGRASQMAGSAARSTSDIPRFRSEGVYFHESTLCELCPPYVSAIQDHQITWQLQIESWIEIASQPSSSSLSSAADEIVTTGLHVQHGSNTRRRRRAQHPIPRGAHFSLQAHSSAGSSQEEYEESESDEDRVMTSSSENVRQSSGSRFVGRPSQKPYDSDSEEADDDDGDSTALGVGNNHNAPFAPQPNAFSHPPSSQPNSRNHVSNPYSRHPSRSQTQPSQLPTNPGRRSHQSHNPYNVVSPSYRADHDAALRASLSTLLSCAAAARGLPKQSQSPPRRRGSSGGPTATTIEPATLRIVPESVVMGEDGQGDSNPNDNPESSTRTKPRRSSSASTSSSASNGASSPYPDKGKRKSTTTPQGQTPKAHNHITKKPRVKPSAAINTPTSEIALISPTLITWVISAGVVVLVSAISFSAGYVMGREVGRGEASGLLGGADIGSDGERAMRGGLRRLRWASTGGKAVV
ncbi:MAG: hypothetical protein M1839_008368 [Geoglossum umbratile]|nr:MAG: hypothetical protein M1839_008368 [Geoglossum umbratile]